jgi:hypothetical protein
MGHSIGLIAIKGNHLAKTDRLFSTFDYIDNGDSKTYTTWTEAVNFVDDNYVEYANRDIALRGIWVDNGWTIIYDPEMVDLLEDEKIERFSKTIGADIWTILIQTTSGSFSFSKFSPNKVRHFFVSNGQITENEGMPLPEETGLNMNEKIFADDLGSLAQTLGFKIHPDTSGDFIVKYLPYNEQMKTNLAQFKQETKSQPTENKPWWKIW